MLKKSVILLIIILIAVPVLAMAEGENLLINGDFEGGVYDESLPNAWFSEMWYDTEEHTVISVEELDGNHILKISNNLENDARIAQNVKVKGNKVYRLSGYIFTYGVNGGQGANLSVEDVMVTTNGVYDSQGEWQYVEIYGRTGLFQSGLKIFVRVGGYGALSSGEAYFDDIKLEQVDDVPKGTVVNSFKKPKATTTKNTEKAGTKFLSLSLIISFLMVLMFLIVKNRIYSKDIDEKGLDRKTIFWMIIFAGLIIRVTLSMSIRGYPNDISSWLGWSYALNEHGLFNLYQSGTWVDYPPGYMYILNVLGFVLKLLESVFGSVPESLQWLIVKIPPITADVLLSILIYKVAKRKMGGGKALALMGLYFLNPVIILVSSAWGQVDGILALFVVLYILALYDRKFWLAGIYLAIGVLMKIQMVMFAPLYLTAMWAAAWEYFKKEKRKEYVRDVLLGVLSGLAVLFFFGMMPFFIIGEGKNPIEFIDLYRSSLDTYNYLSINATNFWTLVGGNWFNVDNLGLGSLSGAFVTFTIGLPILIFLLFGFIDKNKDHIFIHAVLLITGLFVMTVKMHERYMFPVIALLLLSVAFNKRRSSFILLILFSVTQFVNISLVLANEHLDGVRNWGNLLSGAEALTAYKAVVILVSVMVIASYIYMIIVALRMRRGGIEKPKFDLIVQDNAPKIKEKKKYSIESREGFFKSLKKHDYLIMAGLTVVYALVAFINLGSLSGPETNFNTVKSNVEIVVDFGEEKQISEMWFFRGKSKSNASFYVSFSNDINGEFETLDYVRITYGGMFADGEEENAERESIMDRLGIEGVSTEQVFFSNYPDVLKWFSMKAETTARYAKVTIERSSMYMFELGFKDTEGNVISITDLIYDETDESMPLNLLFDEQDTIPESITYMNSTYFDEIYHAGTAWEYLNYVEPYETTHPPLGKVIMSWGIAIFGLNTFGWRFMGTLVGVLMVPVMYILAKLLFKKKRYAFIATFLMTFDFMHFVQTRIATIDSYSVFFIMLMYLFMGIYFYMSYNKSSLIKTLIPLGLSGVFFGLGAASKWICIYAGAGLAVLFFISLFKRWQEYSRVKNGSIMLSPEQTEEVISSYTRKTLITLLWCVLFFIIIPVAIYVASYIPIMKIGPSKDLTYVWNNQINMYNYHSGLDASHSFASPWYEWPFIIKPMWFYSNDALRGTGFMSSIATFGNPAVWWVGTLAMLYLIVDTYLQRKTPKVAVFLIIAFLSQFLPWVLVPRSMFIYHYFASVPFVIMSITYAIKSFEEKIGIDNAETKRIVLYIIVGYYLFIVIMLFILFHPVLSGGVIPSWYGKLLKWMPTWWFTY